MSDITVNIKNVLIFNENFKIENFNDIKYKIVKYQKCCATITNGFNAGIFLEIRLTLVQYLFSP